MNRKRKPDARSASDSGADDRLPSQLRIIGGKFRGRKLKYSGRFETRPMKERVREAIFNLVGPEVAGKHAIDLFAGTGALGLEALSRGAVSATLIERHVPTAQTIRENVESLQVGDAVDLTTASAFVWVRQSAGQMPPLPWVVFCSPPYEFFVERLDEMLALVTNLWETAPVDSILVVEADQRFDFGQLVEPDHWDVRVYPPAVVGVLRKPR